MYGESVFTTMLMLDGEVKDWNLHFDRLSKGIEFVYGPFTDGDGWADSFKSRMAPRLESLVGDKVIRLSVYREQARGLVRSIPLSTSDLRIHFSIKEFDRERVQNKRFRLRTCPAPSRPRWWPAYLKAGNYLDTILSQKIYMKPEDDDILFLSGNDTFLESSVANIFMVRHDKLYTPPVGPNVLDGIMRRKVLQVASDFFSEFEETESEMEHLLKADAVFGTNSIRGLFLVDRIDDNEINYTQEFIEKFERLKSKVFL
jgi:branched-subunit amino acid aminotransferase/4-amino-4-deoxychorismate lyase